MKKTTIPAADFQKKTYAQPQIKVVEIESAELLSGSGDDVPITIKKGQGYEEENW